MTLSLKTSRPYFWLVTVWLYLLPTGQHYELLSSAIFWVGVLYCTYPLNLLCYLMNDIADIANDKGNRRKGTPGQPGYIMGTRGLSDDQLYGIVSWTAMVQAPFLLVFMVTCSVWFTVIWFAAVFGVNWLYNFGPQFSGNFAPLDLLCPCGYVLTIFLSCKLNNVALPLWTTWLHALILVIRSQL